MDLTLVQQDLVVEGKVLFTHEPFFVEILNSGEEYADFAAVLLVQGGIHTSVAH